MLRRDFFGHLIAGGAVAQLAGRPAPAQSQPSGSGVFVEGPAAGQPHKGKVLLALQAHSDDIPLSAAGTVAKLIEEGYTGYWVRATNDDMGDAPGLGTPGTIGENDLRNEKDNEEIARILVSYSKRCEINCRYSSSSDTEFSEEKTHTRAKAFVVVIGWGWMGRLRWRLGAAAGGEQWPDNLLSQ